MRWGRGHRAASGLVILPPCEHCLPDCYTASCVLPTKKCGDYSRRGTSHSSTSRITAAPKRKRPRGGRGRSNLAVHHRFVVVRRKRWVGLLAAQEIQRKAQLHVLGRILRDVSD